MVGESDTQNDVPVIKYILKEPEDNISKTILPRVTADGRQIILFMPKSITIDPGETKRVDLKIKIIFPNSNIIGRFGINKIMRKSYDTEIKNQDSFLCEDSDIKVNIRAGCVFLQALRVTHARILSFPLRVPRSRSCSPFPFTGTRN